MRSVWSFWTKPYFAERKSSWYSEWHHWLAWGLSVHAASRHYPETCLVTDDEGARILVDELQLPFQHVSTGLNGIRGEDSGWWALGKLEAYRLQREPFVHIDTDAFLWNRLAPELEQADVFAQNPEPIVPGASCYRPEEVERVVGAAGGGWLPREWKWFRRNVKRPEAACCSVLGGCRVDFVNHYAAAALRLAAAPRNRAVLRDLPGKDGHMILVEQYLLNACVEYHRERPRSPYRGVEIRYVFGTMEDAYRPQCATEAGFTHLAGGAKRNARVCRHLELRVREELPEYYERCASYTFGGLRTGS